MVKSSLSETQRTSTVLMTSLPHRDIVKLLQRFGEIPAIINLDSNGFEVGEKGGEGGYSSVYFGKSKGKDVAIKFPLRRYSCRVWGTLDSGASSD